MMQKIKSQSAMEFVVLSSFMLLVIVGFFAITTSRMFEASEEIDMSTAQDIAEFTFKEIEIAASVGSGYTRVFSIPRSVNGVNYTIEIIDSRELVINYLGHEYVKFLPANVSGNISKGMVQIRKLDDVILIESVLPQCSNDLDDDGDGKIDLNDPGCYSSCNYLTPSSYSPDWAESDSCTCNHIGTAFCCAGVGINLHYNDFDQSCGIGECWSGCLGSRVLSFKDTIPNSVFFLSDGSLVIRGTLQQNASAVQSLEDEFVVRNSTGTNVMIATQSGNVIITGSLYQNLPSLASSSAYGRFIIKDNENVVAYLDELGDLYLKGNLTENAGVILDS